jgi:hypothetical protein
MGWEMPWMRCVHNATGLQDKQVKELIEDLDSLRKALETHNPR